MQEAPVQFLGREDPWRRNRLPTPGFLGFPCGSAGKESACNAGDLGSIPGLGRSPGEGKGYPLQYSCLENSMAIQSMELQRVRHDWVTWKKKKKKTDLWEVSRFMHCLFAYVKKSSEIKMLCILQGTRAQLQMTFILPRIKLNLAREKEKWYW